MRDIAIQIAIGAPSYRVCWFVVKDMVIAGIIGALIGGIASWWAGKAVAHYIYNGEKYQNLTGLAIATLIMLVIIAVSALLPALRATRIEPGRILNME
jgi:ABC-type antimicrobial peptide transport system permease subunit